MKIRRLIEQLNTEIFEEPYRSLYLSLPEDLKSEIDDESDLDDVLDEEYDLYVTENGNVSLTYVDEKIKEVVKDLPVELFHFTSSDFLDSIRKYGLSTGFNKTNPHGNSYSGVYLTLNTSGPEIEGYKHHIRQKGGEPIMLTVKMFLSELSPDPDDFDLSSGQSQFVTDKISPDRIISYD